MKTRRVLVNLAIVIVFAAIGWFCYDNGKAYDFILDNTPCAAGEQKLDALEAVQISIDGAEPKVFYADDRDQAVAVGSGVHSMRIDMLDLDDKPIPGQSRVYSFRVQELGEKRSLNIPFACANGKAVE